MTRFLLLFCIMFTVSSCGGLSGGPSLLLNDNTDQSSQLDSLKPISPSQESK